MWRFGVPTIFMISAAVLLCAGAFGDLPSWQKDLPIQIPDLTRLVRFDHPLRWFDRRPDAPADQTPDARSRQAQELHAQIAQATRELAALRVNTEQTRRDLASLRQRRDQAQSALQRVEAQTPAATAKPAPEPVAALVPIPPPMPRVVVAQLTQARAALSSGRGSQARRHLRYLRGQMARLPDATSNRTGTGEIRGQVEYAIALLGRGDPGGAMQTIDHALAEANGEAAQRPGPPNGPS